MNRITDSSYWTQLNDTEPFYFMSSRLWEDKGILPSLIHLEGNRQLVFEYEYKGQGSTVRFQATWDFRWQKFYFIKLTRSPLHFRTPDFLDSPFLTGREFVAEIKTLEANESFKRVTTSDVDLKNDDFDYILSRVRRRLPQ